MPSGTQWANVLHLKYSGSPQPPTSVEIAAMDAVMRRLYTGAAYSGGAAWLTFCRSSVTLSDMTAYVLDGSSIPVPINIGVTGSNAAALQLPQEVAHVVTLRTAKRGRSYRGRIYLPAAVTTAVDASGNLNTTNATQVLAQLQGIQSALNGLNWQLGVASYLHSTFDPIASIPGGATMDLRPDVQRRRKR